MLICKMQKPEKAVKKKRLNLNTLPIIVQVKCRNKRLLAKFARKPNSIFHLLKIEKCNFSKRIIITFHKCYGNVSPQKCLIKTNLMPSSLSKKNILKTILALIQGRLGCAAGYGGGRALRLEWARGPNAVAMTGQGAVRCGYDRLEGRALQPRL